MRRLLAVAVILTGTVALLATPAGAWRIANRRADVVQALQLVRPARFPTPDVTFALLDGAPVQLSSLHRRVVVINFWATWCVPCREEMPALQRLAARLGRDGMVIALAADTQVDGVREFAKRYGLSFPLAVDGKGSIFSAFVVRALPTTFVIDGSGRMVGLAVGPRAWDSEASITELRSLATR